MEKKTDINKLYEDHIGLIKSRVSLFKKKYNMSWEQWDELYSEANLLFTELFYNGSFDIGKGKFSTFLVTSIDNHFKNLMKENQRSKKFELDVGDMYDIIFNSKSINSTNHADAIIEKISLQQKIDGLSSTDKEVVGIAMELKNTDSKWAKERNISKTSIKKYLKELGWRAVDIQRSFNRIEVALFS